MIDKNKIMIEKLNKIIGQGWSINLYKLSKRVGELNNRRFEYRYCWEAKLDEYNLKNEWYGFDNNELAIADMCDKINAL